jgi:hypothetical protein
MTVTVHERLPNGRASFAERRAGDDPVQDIIDAADIIRHAHPSFKNKGPLALEDGEVRVFWALTLEAMRKASGLSLDDLIERIRETAKGADISRASDAEND